MKIRELIENVSIECEKKLYQLGDSFLNLEAEVLYKIVIALLVIGLLKIIWIGFKKTIA